MTANGGKVAIEMNDLLNAVAEPIREAVSVLKKMADGDFNSTMQGDYKGDFLQVKNAVNSTNEALSGYIADISEDLEAISGGNLTTKITHEFAGSFVPIKESLNNISAIYHKAMVEISSVCDQVLANANQSATTAENLANGVQVQSDSIKELSASFELLSRQILDDASNAEKAAVFSNKSVKYAEEGDQDMSRMLEAMQQIKESSGNISTIINVIQDIAFQTNLLALNASVEAARAGEHGRGFAVVAEEVRNLAARSQGAATQTTEFIEESISRVNAGSSLAKTTAESLSNIATSANEILQVMEKIHISVKEQMESFDQVNTGLSRISLVVQNNNVVSKDAASAAEELSTQAEFLRQLVGFFKL